jgi:hypothetical protein
LEADVFVDDVVVDDDDVDVVDVVDDVVVNMCARTRVTAFKAKKITRQSFAFW